MENFCTIPSFLFVVNPSLISSSFKQTRHPVFFFKNTGRRLCFGVTGEILDPVMFLTYSRNYPYGIYRQGIPLQSFIVYTSIIKILAFL
jgi:hypothetical protein